MNFESFVKENGLNLLLPGGDDAGLLYQSAYAARGQEVLTVGQVNQAEKEQQESYTNLLRKIVSAREQMTNYVKLLKMLEGDKHIAIRDFGFKVIEHEADSAKLNAHLRRVMLLKRDVIVCATVQGDRCRQLSKAFSCLKRELLI